MLIRLSCQLGCLALLQSGSSSPSPGRHTVGPVVLIEPQQTPHSAYPGPRTVSPSLNVRSSVPIAQEAGRSFPLPDEEAEADRSACPGSAVPTRASQLQNPSPRPSHSRFLLLLSPAVNRSPADSSHPSPSGGTRLHRKMQMQETGLVPPPQTAKHAILTIPLLHEYPRESEADAPPPLPAPCPGRHPARSPEGGDDPASVGVNGQADVACRTGKNIPPHNGAARRTAKIAEASHEGRRA